MSKHEIVKPYIRLKFQQGERKKHGQNGTTMEKVVDELIARLKLSNSGLYKNQDTETAILYLEQTKESLQARSRVFHD